MFQRTSQSRIYNRQRGQVLAEAVVVMLALVILLVSMHLTGRLQFKWLTQWRNAQVAADAVALEHVTAPVSIRVDVSQDSRWHKPVMREFRIGGRHWISATGKGPMAQTAWRLAGVGQASRDLEVVQRIERASVLWQRAELASKAIVHALVPALKAIEAPWDSRGSLTEWFKPWQGHTPAHYLGQVR